MPTQPVPTNFTDQPVSRRRRRLTAALLALPLAPLLPGRSAHAQRHGIVGRPAPELAAEFWIDARGAPTTFSMRAQRGKWVHLKCWQSWCPGCHEHGFPALQKLTAAFASESRVINVALQTVFEGHWINTASKVRDTQVRYNLPIVFGHDPGRRNANGYPNTMVSYRTGGTPWHVLVDPEGIVVFNGFGIDADKVIEFLRTQLTTPA